MADKSCEYMWIIGADLHGSKYPLRPGRIEITSPGRESTVVVSRSYGYGDVQTPDVSVNWSAHGSVSTDDARCYGEMISAAVRAAAVLDRGGTLEDAACATGAGPHPYHIAEQEQVRQWRLEHPEEADDK